MTYGVQIRNYKREVFFDSTRTTWNYLGTFTAQANASASYTIPSVGLVLKEVHISRTLLDRPRIDKDAPKPVVHDYTMSGSTINAFSGTVATQFVVLGR